MWEFGTKLGMYPHHTKKIQEEKSIAELVQNLDQAELKKSSRKQESENKK